MVQEQKKVAYTTLGLKCGLELHQQLNTGRKLFCHCKAELRLDPAQAVITRHMRPTLSELGEYDQSALMEYKKKKIIKYEIHDSICTYEIDETPPFNLDINALDIALTITRLLKMDVVDEIHVNRKQYLDGSIPTGFQRTMIVGVNGQIDVINKKIDLEMLALEEDSCREIKDVGREIVWRVDRLGTPLVEIATKPIMINDPEEVKLIAESIGRILRSTGKVKRGLGTIRQDLNISIEKGARVELKGVQILDMLPVYVQFEVNRQISLLEIKEELLKRNLSPAMFEVKYSNCHELFKKTKCQFLLKALKNNDEILGIKLLKMKGLLGKKIQGDRTFGKEIADRVKIITGLGGLIHTDELPNYGITKEELESIRSFYNCMDDDAVVLIIGKKLDAEQAIQEIIIRMKEAFKGVPNETRHANDDGTNRFERYLGSASRMYPDTDTKPIVINEEYLKYIDANLPEMPDKKEARYIQMLNLPKELAKNLAISTRASLFDELVLVGIDPMIIAITLEQTLKSLARENVVTDNISDEKMKEIFLRLKDKKVAKEAIEPLLVHFSKFPESKIDEAIKTLHFETIAPDDLMKIIEATLQQNQDFIKENGARALGKIMGSVMNQVRGKIDGKIVNEFVTKKFHEKLTSLGLK